MKRFTTTMCCLALGAIMLSPTTMVSPANATITRHMKREDNRINAGTRKGQLTPKERTRLLNQQGIIKVERQVAMADGKMTKREHRDIRHDQKRLSHDIHRKRHNKKHY